MRGTILHLTREQAVARAISQITATPKMAHGEPHPIAYRLEGGFNGGFDPTAPHCASSSYGDKVPTADCIGFVLWASGVDRKQPGYVGASGDWLNCVSLLADAHGAQKFCRTLKAGETPLPGDWLLTKDHIGMIIRPPWYDYVTEQRMRVLVVDCSPRHGRQDAINTGDPWSVDCEPIRPLIYV